MEHFEELFLDEKEEKDLWQNAIFVLDTSAICGIYNLTDHYRKIMIEILSNLEQRLWIPNQVKIEYFRNRKKSIMNPKKEKYALPSVIKNKFVIEVRQLIEEWENNKYFHPYLDEDKLNIVKDEIEKANNHIRIVKDTIEEQYRQRIKEIENIESNDELLSFILKINCGSPLTFYQIMEIVKEGDLRYRNQIPPGYCDNEKGGIRKYGDLIIWKSIIDYSKVNKKNIIFISNDLKEDWIYIDGKHKGKPLVEILAEFKEQTDCKIWMYSMIQFIEQLKKQYKDIQTLPLFDELENVVVALRKISLERVNENGKYGEKIILKCSNCGYEFECWSDELSLEWDYGTSEERSMGDEVEWLGEGYICCPDCCEQIDISIRAYEYPMQIYNYGEIDCENGAILNKPNIQAICPIEEYYKNKKFCEKCGELAELSEYGLCDCCMDEFNRFINSDD